MKDFFVKNPLFFSLFSFCLLSVSGQNREVPDSLEQYVNPSGNAVNFYLFHFMDYAAYTGAEKQWNIIADGNVSHFLMPHANYRLRTGTDIALGKSHRRHGLGVAGDIQRLGGSFTGGFRLSYAFQVIDKPNVQMRIGIMGGAEFVKWNKTDATFGDMIDDRYGFVYPTNESLVDFDKVQINPRSAAGVWFRLYGFGLAFNISELIPVNVGVSGYLVRHPTFTGIGYYQIPVKKVQLMPSVAFRVYGNWYRVEGGLSFYMNPGKGLFAGVFGSSSKDLKILAGYTVHGRFKIYAGMTFFFEGLAEILPIYDGFGGMNVNFTSYGR